MAGEAVPLAPGADGEPVPAAGRVLRLGPQPPLKNLNDPAHAMLAEKRAWPGLFAFSSQERKTLDAGSAVRLSVWHTSLTTPGQAWILVGAKNSNRILLTLGIETVRAISAPPDQQGNPATPALDVVWESAVRPDPHDPARTVADGRDGAAGHCGIANLGCGSKAQQGKLRELLSDAVAELVVLTDDDIATFRADFV